MHYIGAEQHASHHNDIFTGMNSQMRRYTDSDITMSLALIDVPHLELLKVHF